MRKMNVKYLLLIILVGIVVPSYAQLNIKASEALIERVVPKNAYHFTVEEIPAAKDGEDVFEIESRGAKIVLRGNNGVSVASALYYYLRHFTHSLITWNGVNLDLPKKLPAVEDEIRKKTPYNDRYYLNYCTFNYTMAWWDWKRWQWEIDWMAMNGINMPLAITGQTAVWQKVYKEMGFTDKELANFFSGPAYFAWFWMSNLDAWGGPLPQHWIDTHEELQKKILQRERDLGMTPVLPAFTGHVPPSFSKRFPEADVDKVKWNDCFAPINILNPEDSLFTAIGKKFLQAQNKIYGTDHLYSSDVFNEVTPPTKDSLYLDKISKKVYQAMYDVDTAAVWVMQGWLFHYQRKYWQPTQIQALLNAVPDDKMIILDLISERSPIWNKTHAFYGKEWIWNMLHNFGGNVFLWGCMHCVANQPATLQNLPKKAGNMVGIGLTMEGTEQNPAIYQLMLDNTWRDTNINLTDWIKRYVHQRYGSLNKDALKAWDILRHTVYGYKDVGSSGGSESIITGRPTFNKSTRWTYTKLSYDPAKLLEAWKLLIKASDKLGDVDGFQFDLVDVTRQVLANYADPLQQEIAQAFKVKNVDKFEKRSHQFLHLMDDMNKLLGTREDFLLGKWLEDARSWGITKEEKDLYEFNARDLITLWGGKDCSLHDYANKQWNGLLEGFYKPRWEQFFASAEECLKTGKTFDRDKFETQIKDWEWQWVHGHEKYPSKPQGNSVKVAKQMYEKYYSLIKNTY